MSGHERAVSEVIATDVGDTDETAIGKERDPIQSVATDDEDARHERFMEIARKVMHQHRNVLAALAK